MVKHWSKLLYWLRRHRRLAIALSALFLIFELSRAASIGQILLPGWSEAMGVHIESILSRPLWITATTIILAVLFFAVPMAAVLYAGVRIRRTLSRYWTGFNRRG